MDKQHRLNLLLWSLLALLFLATILMIVKFYIGRNILTNNRRNVDIILNSLNQENQLQLTSPVFKTTDPTKGQNVAENTIVVFSNFNCPYCQQQADALDQLENKYPNKLFIIWKDLVPALDLTGKMAALAARCAQAQDKFWQYHDYLFANQDDTSEDLYQNIAQKLNLNLDKFNQCLLSQEPLVLIESDIEEAGALGIDATPYLFINGQRNSGALTLAELESKLKLKNLNN
jgi:protein-disulfide isomerase